MSFLNIKDRKEREATIKDYLATVDRIKKRNSDDRTNTIDYQRQLAEDYGPVLASNKEMTEKITDQLIPIKNDLGNLNALISRPKAISRKKQIIGVKRRLSEETDGELNEVEDDIPIKEEAEEEEEKPSLGSKSMKFLNTLRDDVNRKENIDDIFGIRKEGNIWKIGNKRVTLNPDDSMVVEEEIYEGTPGFWSLVVEKNPKTFSPTDYKRYKELLHETSALHQEYNPLSHYPRANKSKKWKKILAPIWREFQEEGIVEEEETDKSGEGVKMYLQKEGKCYDLKKTVHGALQISPRPKLTGVCGDGLYLRYPGSGIYTGEGFILGENSPFKNIPILGWIL